MAVREILKMGDARLLRVAQPVPIDRIPTPWFAQLLQDLHDTMAAANGAGLAAPQIAEDWQVVVFGSGEVNPRYPDAPPIARTVLVNPVITPLGHATVADWEGCLSVPGLRGKVLRHNQVMYQGLNERGEPVERRVSGFHARVVQHECDHLIGRLYPTRLSDFTQFGFTEVLFPTLTLG